MIPSKIESVNLETMEEREATKPFDFQNPAERKKHRVMKVESQPSAASFLVLLAPGERGDEIIHFAYGTAWLGSTDRAQRAQKKRGVELPPHDFSVTFGPSDLLRFLLEADCDYRRKKARFSTVHFDEIPLTTQFLGSMIPEATKWGRFDVGPQVGVVGRHQGHNTTQVLGDWSWNTLEESEKWTESSFSSLLHPKAEEYAARIPSAWGLAVYCAYAMGGLREPSGTPYRRWRLKDSVFDYPVLNQAVVDDSNFSQLKRGSRGAPPQRQERRHVNTRYNHNPEDALVDVGNVWPEEAR